MKAQARPKKQLQEKTGYATPLQIATNRRTAMFRPLLALSTLMVAAAPAAAATYSAKPAVPTSQRIIARDIVWQCGPAACQGSTAESRPVVLCESLAKKAGRIENFLVDGRAFSQAELDRCNASAKPASTSTLAAQ
jgi:hypothetical protein